jgi:hypothetical protein
MTAPERIWAWEITERGIPQGAGGWIRHKASGDHEYILHTRAALAASPLVQEIVAEAVKAERSNG